MRYECKYCGKNQTRNLIQEMINDIILSGKKYISNGVEREYKEISWCKCNEQ
tara:strand:- start:320 stop:475 length:156 start_codon:yes stop_codon:yes gene_type:complete